MLLWTRHYIKKSSQPYLAAHIPILQITSILIIIKRIQIIAISLVIYQIEFRKWWLSFRSVERKLHFFKPEPDSLEIFRFAHPKKPQKSLLLFQLTGQLIDNSIQGESS